MLTFEVEQIDSSAEALEQSHVDENTGRVELDVTGVLGAVVGVVPLVGRQKKLHQGVGCIGLAEGRMMRRA